jgi:predicted Na+-dependent transporter
LTIIGFLVAKLNGIVGKFNKEKCISLIFAGGLRNFSVILTIAVTFFPEAVALPTLICIIFQQILAAIMGKVIIRR